MNQHAHAPSSEPTSLGVADAGMVFDTNVVLRDVSMHVNPGEIVGLIGENGAGKSTVMDIMCGVLQPTAGTVVMDGADVEFHSPVDAARRGVYRVFQEQSVIPRLPVFVNLCLGAEDHFTVAGVFRKRAAQEHARALLAELGLSYDVDKPVSAYSFGQRQLLELARAVSLSRIYETREPVILLDEPTAALSGGELELFFALVTRLRDAGTGFLFVSHRLNELLEYSDRLYVMKDGAVVAEVPASTSESELHRLMVGRERAEDMYQKGRQCGPGDDVRLRATDLTSDGLKTTSLAVHRGEVVGVGGLLGSGKNQLAAALFGAAGSRGEIEIDGVAMGGKLEDRVAAGVGYIPLHRHAEGASLGLTVSQNINEVRLGRGGDLALRAPKRERARAAQWIDKLRVRTRSPEQTVRTLSGGNQQKVVFAKWLSQGADVIIADNPTRGVDAGAKEEIYAIMRDLTADGASVVLVSDDLSELIGLSDRILVMHDGEVVGEVASTPESPAREEDVVSLMV
ncbi:MAG: ABC transporter ATP-binding protein [Microbacterium sp.]|nr:ABC transporter ATP-binding protein [Microbacterium sp.]